MIVKDALREASTLLTEKRIETPFLDAVVLLCFAAGITKEKLFVSYPEKMDDNVLNLYKGYLKKRINGIPVSYIRSRKEFFGLDFFVDKRVLIPRPDTETIVECSLEIAKKNRWINDIHDTGTGSGCIAISIKYNRKDLCISASDISAEAAEVFMINCHKHRLNIPFYKSSFLKEVPGTFDMIVSNPPYLSDKEYSLMKNAGWPEPALALTGGDNGLENIFTLIKASINSLNNNGYLLIEAASVQMPIIRKEMKRKGYNNIIIIKDLSGRDRVITAQWSEKSR